MVEGISHIFSKVFRQYRNGGHLLGEMCEHRVAGLHQLANRDGLCGRTGVIKNSHVIGQVQSLIILRTMQNERIQLLIEQ